MTQQQARIINNDELAILVKVLRDARKWTQEQLAEISNLNIRTIQRVENGVSASFDTRRALARSFEASDIDCFNKAHVFPTQEEIETAIHKANTEYLILDARELRTGRLVGDLAEWCRSDMSTCDFELPFEVQHAYAEFLDLFRDFRDCAELYSQVEKLTIYNSFDTYLNIIQSNGFCIKYAKRAAILKANQSGEIDLPLDIVYLSIFPKKQVPDQFSVARKISFKF
ncbi:helix-turn-helix domain-containing protein [Acinetobacter defluvii]|uniref:Helix-turn-helix domain-containing protein n=1 Tax=Acinetobacter defluvii TaxID=1871111 RepID=A0A2S2FAB7_9GAMM|nr:helix-turn-helix transcriptional regulator [Acinetobacter defluvii]AWL27897.1 helix-turn-helix domain-containing protein [Acinetobacter defluvii]